MYSVSSISSENFMTIGASLQFAHGKHCAVSLFP
jgi:hypothetical protein